MKFGDFKINREVGPEEIEYVEWITERGSKTRTGEHEFVPDRAFNTKMYATRGPRCPVRIFKEYLSRRPADMNSRDAPFYLASIPNPASKTWFKNDYLTMISVGKCICSQSSFLQVLLISLLALAKNSCY